MKKFEEIFRIVRNTRHDSVVPETYNIERQYQSPMWWKEKWSPISSYHNEHECLWVGSDEYCDFDAALDDYKRLKIAYETEMAFITKTQVYP